MTRFGTWAQEEDIFLKTWYGRMSLRKLSEKISRPWANILAHCRAIGLRSPRNVLNAKDRRTIRRLARKGFSDRDIAKRINRDVHRVGKYRKEMGIPSNKHNLKHCQKIGDASRKAVREGKNRISSLQPGTVERRKKLHQRFAERSGWPSDLKPRETEILNVLAKIGLPLTLSQLADALTIKREALRYPSTLIKRGLVLRLSTFSQVGAKAHRPAGVFTLGIAALEILERNAK